MEKIRSNLNQEKQGEVLQAFSNAITREGPYLTQNPEMLWQQLYNRLQWESEITKKQVATEYNLRIQSNGIKWLHLISSLQESNALIRTLEGHTNQVTVCDFSPDRLKLISASWDRTMKIWDVRSGQCEHTLMAPKSAGRVEACSFSPDGKRIVSDGGIIWDTRTGKMINALDGRSGGIRKCQYIHGGKQIISAYGKSIAIWDAINGKQLQSLEGYYKGVDVCKISPDGDHVLTASDKSIWLWKISSGEIICKKYLRYGVKDCDFSPDGNLIVAASIMSIFIWNDLNKDPIAEINSRGGVKSLTVSPDNKAIFATSDEAICLWDVDTHKLIHKFNGHTERINHITSSSDGALFATASIDKTIKIWNPNIIDKDEDRTPEAKLGKMNFSTYSSSGCLIVSAGSAGDIKLWNDSTGAILHTLKGHRGPVRTCAFSPKGDRIVSSSHDKTVRIWDTGTGKAIRSLYSNDKTFTCHFSPDNDIVAASSIGHQVYVWDSTSGSLIFNLKPQADNQEPKQVPVGSLFTPETAPGSSQDFCFSPNGSQIISINNKQLLFLSSETGEIERKIVEEREFFKKCVFSPDGKQILTANSNASRKLFNLDLWDAKSGKRLRKFGTHTGEITSCHFSPDGKLILTTSEEKVLNIWDIASETVIMRLSHMGSMLWGEFHPWKPSILYCDHAGHVYRIECIGLTYDPVILTAIESDHQLTFQCPSCQQIIRINPKQLGGEMTCGTPGCGLRIKLNTFSLMSKDPGKPRGLKSGSTINLQTKTRKPSITDRPNMALPKLPGTQPKVNTSLDSFRVAAENGDPKAQMTLGTYYANGKGVPRDLQEAAHWYRKSADAGYAPAQLLLGSCYAYGNGVPKDAVKAVAYYRKAALAGNRMAQFRLGECYEKGSGVTRDVEEAILWIKKASDQGLGLARNKLNRLQANKETYQRPKSTNQTSNNFKTSKSRIGGQPSVGNSLPESLLGKRAAILRSQGDLKGALKLYKEQEKVFRGQANLPALKANLMIQNEILKEILAGLDDQLSKKQGK